MSTPSISIALATYNGERYISKLLDSLCWQSFRDFELIVSDDGSQDGTLRLVESYSGRLSVKVIANPGPRGFSANFENALNYCRGDYVALCDQDDIWLPEKLDVLMAQIGRSSLIYSDAILIDAKESLISESAWKHSNLPINSGKPFEALLHHGFVIGCTALFNRELLDVVLPIPGQPTKVHHDWWLSLMACKLRGISKVNTPLVKYRIHEQNALGLYRNTVEKRLFQFLTRSSPRNAYREQIDRLMAIRNCGRLDSSELDAVDRAIRYNKSRMEGVLHWEAFRICLRHRIDMFPMDKGIFIPKRIVGSLFR